MTEQHLFALAGFGAGSVLITLIWILSSSISRGGRQKAQKRREQIQESVGELCAGVTNAFTAFSMRTMDGATLRNTVSASLQEITTKLYKQMHLFDPFFIKYIEKFIEERTEALNGLAVSSAPRPAVAPMPAPASEPIQEQLPPAVELPNANTEERFALAGLDSDEESPPTVIEEFQPRTDRPTVQVSTEQIRNMAAAGIGAAAAAGAELATEPFVPAEEDAPQSAAEIPQPFAMPENPSSDSITSELDNPPQAVVDPFEDFSAEKTQIYSREELAAKLGQATSQFTFPETPAEVQDEPVAAGAEDNTGIFGDELQASFPPLTNDNTAYQPVAFDEPPATSEQPPVELVDQQSPLGQQSFLELEPAEAPAPAAAPAQEPVEEISPQAFEEMAQETIDMDAFSRQASEGSKEQEEDMITGDDVIRKMDDLFKF